MLKLTEGVRLGEGVALSCEGSQVGSSNGDSGASDDGVRPDAGKAPVGGRSRRMLLPVVGCARASVSLPASFEAFSAA